MSPVFSAQANSVRVGAPPVLEVNHIEKVYGSRGAVTRALNDVSFIVETGEFVGIMGASGSGKSTLLNCVSTIDAVTSGGIFVDGQDVTKIKSAKLAKFRREQLGFIFQDSNLLDTLTARENIALPLTIGRLSADETLMRVQEMAARLNISDVLDKYPFQLSGGQQQRVSIARALCMNPKILFFDEPTSALDPELTSEILKVIKDLAAEHITMVIVTHEMTFARDISDHIIFMDKGLIAVEGSPKEVFESEHARMKEFLGKFHQG